MTEIWKDISGYEGLYQVSNLGRVLSLYSGQGRFQGPRIRIPQKNRFGYLCVRLCHHSKSKEFKIHRLVAGAFLDNPENKPDIDHKNSNRADNGIENLQWVTTKENVNLSQKRGRFINPPIIFGENCHNAIMGEKQVRIYKWAKKINPKISKSIFCRMFGVTLHNFYLIDWGKNWRHITI